MVLVPGGFVVLQELWPCGHSWVCPFSAAPASIPAVPAFGFVILGAFSCCCCSHRTFLSLLLPFLAVSVFQNSAAVLVLSFHTPERSRGCGRGGIQQESSGALKVFALTDH